MSRELDTLLTKSTDVCPHPMALTETITLRQFLGGFYGALTVPCRPGDVKPRIVVSRELTEAVMIFYKTSMMPRPWTEDTIEFMTWLFECENGVTRTAVTHTFPMVSAPADLDDDRLALHSPFNVRSSVDRKFPEIKALGVLLLQIWLEVDMARLSERYPAYFHNGTVTTMGQIALRQSLHTGMLKHLHYDLHPVCTVVEKCFNDDLFEERGGKCEPTEYVRNMISKHLWKPLDKLMESIERSEKNIRDWEAMVKEAREKEAREKEAREKANEEKGNREEEDREEEDREEGDRDEGERVEETSEADC